MSAGNGYVWIVIRDLEGVDGPEVDVFDEEDVAIEHSERLKAAGYPYIGPQEQPVMTESWEMD